MNKEILKLAIPNIISNISIPFLSSVDTILMGSISTQHLGAIGIGSMIFNVLYWNFGFLRMGTTAIVAQAYGEKNNSLLSNTLLRSIFLAILISAILLLFKTFILELALSYMNVHGKQIDHVKNYFDYRIWAAPASLMLYSLMGCFFGMQNSIYPLAITILLNIINIITSYYLVYHLDLSIKGVALGTLIAQYSGLIVAGVLILHKYKNRLNFSLKNIFDRKEFKRFSMINSDLFQRTILLNLTFCFFMSQISSLGAKALAVHIIYSQFLNWVSYIIDGFAFAAESLIGKYYGAKNKMKYLLTIKKSFFLGALSSVLMTIGITFFHQSFFELYSKDLEVITLATKYKAFLILIPIVTFIAYIWDGIYLAITASKEMKNSMFLACILFFIGYLVLERNQEINLRNLWIIFILFMTTRGVSQFIWYHFKIKNKFID